MPCATTNDYSNFLDSRGSVVGCNNQRRHAIIIALVIWQHKSSAYACYQDKIFYINIARGFGSSPKCNTYSTTPLYPVSILCPKFCWGWWDDIWASLDKHLDTRMHIDATYLLPTFYYGMICAFLFAAGTLLMLNMSLCFAPDERLLSMLYALGLSIVAALTSLAPLCAAHFTDILSPDVWEHMHEVWRSDNTCTNTIQIEYTLSGWLAAASALVACGNMILLYVLYLSYQDATLNELYLVSECISPISPPSPV